MQSNYGHNEILSDVAQLIFFRRVKLYWGASFVCWSHSSITCLSIFAFWYKSVNNRTDTKLQIALNKPNMGSKLLQLT